MIIAIVIIVICWAIVAFISAPSKPAEIKPSQKSENRPVEEFQSKPVQKCPTPEKSDPAVMVIINLKEYLRRFKASTTTKDSLYNALKLYECIADAIHKGEYFLEHVGKEVGVVIKEFVTIEDTPNDILAERVAHFNHHVPKYMEGILRKLDIPADVCELYPRHNIRAASGLSGISLARKINPDECIWITSIDENSRDVYVEVECSIRSIRKWLNGLGENVDRHEEDLSNTLHEISELNRTNRSSVFSLHLATEEVLMHINRKHERVYSKKNYVRSNTTILYELINGAASAYHFLDKRLRDLDVDPSMKIKDFRFFGTKHPKGTTLLDFIQSEHMYSEVHTFIGCNVGFWAPLDDLFEKAGIVESNCMDKDYEDAEKAKDFTIGELREFIKFSLEKAMKVYNCYKNR